MPRKRAHHRVCVGVVLDAYLTEHASTLRRSSEVLYTGLVRNHLQPAFRDLGVAALRQKHAYDYGVAKLEGLDAETQQQRFAVVGQSLRVLRAALNWWWEEHDLDVRCPSRHVSRAIGALRQRHHIPRHRRREAYTRAEAEVVLRVAKEVDPLVHDLYRVAFGTGLRLSEILGIAWRNVATERDVLIPPFRKIGVRGTPELYKVEREAPVAFAPSLRSLFLQRWKARTSEEWVFATEGGSALVPRNVQRRITRVRRAAEKEGVPFAKTFHGARHAFASEGLAAGADLAFVSHQLGHHSVAFTAAAYGHHVDRERNMSFAEFV